MLLLTFVVIVVAAGWYHLNGQYNDAVDNAFRTARSTALTVESHAARTFGAAHAGTGSREKHRTDVGAVEEVALDAHGRVVRAVGASGACVEQAERPGAGASGDARATKDGDRVAFGIETDPP